jgi:hypothetical protein
MMGKNQSKNLMKVYGSVPLTPPILKSPLPNSLPLTSTSNPSTPPPPPQPVVKRSIYKLNFSADILPDSGEFPPFPLYSPMLLELS